MKSTCTLLILLLFATCLQANNTSEVSGLITDLDGESLPFATVILMNATDSSLAKAAYSDDEGKFNLAPIEAGTYFLKVTYTSMESFYSESFAVVAGETKQIQNIVLRSASSSLAAVSITTQKPMITIKPDMTVFNVSASVNAIGTNALDLLRKAPGVTVDNNDNIMLQGKNGVRIYIDGKPSPLAGADLAAMLRALPSSQIESIEIITNPSARYDAEGNAGIINIVLLKNECKGANANLDLGYAIQQNSRYSGAVSGNYRNEKFNVFGSLSRNSGLQYNFMDLYRVQSGYVYEQDLDIVEDSYNELSYFIP